MTDKDYYEILGVAKDAESAQIKSAYRDLALKYHPDRNKDNPEAMEMMKKVNEAYAVLSDPQKRGDYDSLRRQYGHSGAQSQFYRTYSQQDIFKGTDINDIFDELARNFGYRGFSDLSKEFHMKGGRSFEFQRPGMNFKGFFFTGNMNFGRGRNRKSLGRGMIGKLLRMAGQSLLGTAGAPGNLDFFDHITISPDLAEKGGPYAYYHKWQSKKLVVKIPPGIKSGQKIRLAGMGRKDAFGSAFGDLYLVIEVRESLAQKLKRFLPFAK